MNRDLARQLATVLAVIATITINALANIVRFNGLNTGEISDRFNVFFVPAGYVFSIWGVIYIGMLAFATYQALPRNRESQRLRRIGWWFVLSCVANCVWLFLWHYLQFVPTLLAMGTLLLTLIQVYVLGGVGRSTPSTAERWCVDIPMSVYLGWVSVATIANVTSVLDFVGWGGWGISPPTWAVIMLVVASALALAMATSRRDISFLLVLIWAFAGIGVKQSATPSVATAAWLATAAVGLMAAATLLTRRPPRAVA